MSKLIVAMAAGGLLCLVPSILGAIWDISSDMEIIMKPLFMFWGGMVYMYFLKGGGKSE